MTELASYDGTFVDFLSQSGLLDGTRASQLSELVRSKGESPFMLANRTGMVAEEQLLRAASDYMQWPIIPYAELAPVETLIAETAKSLQLSTAWCERNGIAVWLSDGALVCATCDLPQRAIHDFLRLKADQSGKSLRFRLARPADIANVHASMRNVSNRHIVQSGDLTHLRELAEEGPVVELVNSFLSQAVTRRASDIHVEPGEAGFVVRVRVDGVMRDLQQLGLDRFEATVCRIKILSQLDIAERRLPQDGRMTARIHGESFDVRVSVLPGVHGESVVMRLLRQDRPTLSLADLGMLEDHESIFKRWIDVPNGIVLVTGPTGSGKTTTLYTALDLGNDGLKKIITVEDPVEYKLKGITQLQVNADIGFTFAAALRSILRHDPDVILIGEIRDNETAGIAVQSALTGHLVFSTLHTNSAVSAITRLVDVGIERFLLVSSLQGVMAQRLVRRLCPHCSVPVELHQLDTAHQRLLSDARASFETHEKDGDMPPLRRAVGCEVCMHTGYLGRVAIYELFDVDDTLRQHIVNAASEADITRSLRERGVRTLAGDGLLKVWRGITTVSEVLAVA
jgi:general secretion pathway protein E